MKKKGFTPEEMDTLMNKKSGLQALCGSADMRDVHKERENGNKRAELAFRMLVHGIKKILGSYFFLLGGKVDAVTFTAGIGEHDELVRAAVMEGLEGIGFKLDPEANRARKSGARAIYAPDSRIPILVIPTNEELQIAETAVEVVSKNK